VNHDPLWSQYIQYLNNLLHAILGIYHLSPTPVTEVIAQDLPWTLVLVGLHCPQLYHCTVLESSLPGARHISGYRA